MSPSRHCPRFIYISCLTGTPPRRLSLHYFHSHSSPEHACTMKKVNFKLSRNMVLTCALIFSHGQLALRRRLDSRSRLPRYPLLNLNRIHKRIGFAANVSRPGVVSATTGARHPTFRHLHPIPTLPLHTPLYNAPFAPSNQIYKNIVQEPKANCPS